MIYSIGPLQDVQNGTVFGCGEFDENVKLPMLLPNHFRITPVYNGNKDYVKIQSLNLKSPISLNDQPIFDSTEMMVS